MKSDPSYFSGDQLPVESVNWSNAIKYCEAIGGRLPTEAEWEYAARGGRNASRYGKLEAIAWYDSNSGGTTHPGGGKQPNQFGLFDMLGNVWEWVQDDYAPYKSGSVIDPLVEVKGSRFKVMRGGSWEDVARDARASTRFDIRLPAQGNFIGFRCAAELR